MVKKIFLVILISFLSIYSFLGKGLPPTHDGEYHVIRFYEFDKTLRDGNLYPRWAPDLNNGFGVPLFNYVYPLPNYVSSFLHGFGSSFIDAFKLNMLFATLVGSILVFFWAREFWGDVGGLVSSSFFSFAPYRLLDIYIRGTVGEVWALSLFPGFLWAITKYSKEKKRRYAIFSSLFLSLVIFAHNILALMFFAFALFYIFFVLDRKRFFAHCALVLLGLGLASIFWLPAILETGYTRGLQIYDYSQNFPEFYQLIFPSWGSGFSNSLPSNQLSFQIGIANLLAILLSAFLMLRKKAPRKIIVFFLVSFALIVLLMLRVSLPIWKVVPLMNYFQFPWRFLSLEILIAGFLAGSVVRFWKPKVVAILSVLLVFLLGLGYAKLAYFLVRPDSYYITRSNFIDGTNSPGNTFNTAWFVNKPKQKEKVVTSAKIKNEKLKSTKYSFIVSSPDKTQALVNTAYFPGWTYYSDNVKKPIQRTIGGLMKINIDKGTHNINIVLENTGIQNIGAFLSFLSLIILLLWNFRFDKMKIKR